MAMYVIFQQGDTKTVSYWVEARAQKKLTFQKVNQMVSNRRTSSKTSERKGKKASYKY